MSRSPALLLSAVVLAVIAWGWLRLGQAGGRMRAAQQQLATTVGDLQRLADLRAQVQAPVRGRRPQDELVTRAQQALAGAGLPVAAFSGLQPRADQDVNGLRIQTVQLRLQGLRPADFGAWLAAWTTPDQPWRLGELQMVHTGGRAAAGGPDGNRYDFLLILVSPYLEDGP